MKRTLLPVSLLTIAALTVLPGCSTVIETAVSLGNNCEYTVTRTGQAPAGAAKRLSVDNTAGNLTVRGDASATEVTYTAKICAPTQGLMDQVKIDLTQSGESVRLTAHIPQDSHGTVPSVNFEVKLPAAMVVTGENTVGNVDIQHVAGLDLTTTAGNFSADDITGDLTVRNTAGNTTLSRVAGAALLDTGAGNVILTDMTGDITLKDKSAGNVTITRAGHDVHMTDAGAGNLTLSAVDGAVSIGAKSAGNIQIDGAGSVNIDRAGVGNIGIKGVKGDLRIGSKGPGNLSYSGIGGQVQVPDR